MSWQQKLRVTGGQVWIRSTEEEDVYRVDGLVECGEEYLVWFQRLRYPDAARHLAALREAQEFQVVAGETEPISTVRLGPRIMPIEEAQPTNFLTLCDRLLAPSPEEDWHGYNCEISLRIGAEAEVDVFIQDRFYEDRQGDFVEFMHMQPPLTFIAHKRRLSFTSRQIVELVLKLELDWPLPYEAIE